MSYFIYIALSVIFFGSILISFIPLNRKVKKVERYPFYLLYVLGFVVFILLAMVCMVIINPHSEHSFSEIIVIFVNLHLINLLIRGFFYGFHILKKENYYLGFSLYLMIIFLIIPDIAFGVSYQIWNTLYSGEQLNQFQAIYFSFATHYSLPMSEEPFVTVIKNINTHFYFRFLELEHVIINKLTEIVVIGFISSKIIHSLQNRVNKEAESKKTRRIRMKKRNLQPKYRR